MARVPCRVEMIELENDRGWWLDSVRVTCSRCEKKTESYGRGGPSIRRCFVLLKDGCDERNFYYDEDDAEDMTEWERD